MKKIFAILSIILNISLPVNAGQGGYIGVDGIFSNARHTMHIVTTPADLSNIDPTSEGTSTSGDGYGLGLNSGIRVDIERAFLAPEIFYDFLNNHATDTFASIHPNEKQDSLEVESRFGARMNIGFNIVGGLNIFANAGVANVKYAVRWPSQNRQKASSENSPIYGGGFIYDIDHNTSLKFAYDYQSFSVPYILEGLRNDVLLQTLKLGLVYSF